LRQQVFIYVKHISLCRPFLPYKDSNDTLLFPTGKFVGVYYSEELKYARSLGYTILPLRGYLFEEKPSPFDGFVSSLFSLRQEARRARITCGGLIQVFIVLKDNSVIVPLS
jgi:hypothetical protein